MKTPSPYLHAGNGGPLRIDGSPALRRRFSRIATNSISGVMIESFLEAGNQSVPKDLSQLKYGVSITDKCIDWATTERCLREAHARLKACGGRKVD